MITPKTNSNLLNRLAGFSIGLFVFSMCLTSCAPTDQGCTVTANIAKEDGWSRLLAVTDFGGSTFKACKTGAITTLTIKVKDASVAQPTAMLFLENGLGNGVGGYQSVADYHQNVNIKGGGKTTTITLKKPFPVKKDERYTWYFQKDPDAGPLVLTGASAPSNTYTNGQTWFNNQVYPTMDNFFSIKIK